MNPLSRTLRHAAAGFAAAACLISGSLFGIMAEDTAMPAGSTSGMDSISVSELLGADPQNVWIPNIPFTLSVTPAAPVTADQLEGVEGGLVLGTSTLNDQTTETTLDAVLSKFTQPGIYMYTLSETYDTKDPLYDSITIEPESYTIEVYVDDAPDGGLKISGIVAYAKNKTTKTEKVAFKNTYTSQTADITKAVTGDQGNLNQEFKFTLNITGPQGKEYEVIAPDGTTETVKMGEDFTVQLKNDQTVEITGLNQYDTLNVVENDANIDGYTTTISSDDDAATISDTDGKITLTGADNSHTTYTNSRGVVTPTGFSQNNWPFILLLGGAVIIGAGVVYSRRKANR